MTTTPETEPESESSQTEAPPDAEVAAEPKTVEPEPTPEAKPATETEPAAEPETTEPEPTAEPETTEPEPAAEPESAEPTAEPESAEPTAEPKPTTAPAETEDVDDDAEEALTASDDSLTALPPEPAEPAEPSTATPTDVTLTPAPFTHAPEPKGLAFLADWFKRQPLFALLLLFIVFGSPYVVIRVRNAHAKATLEAGLDGWLESLKTAGLPVPFIPAQKVEVPLGLTAEPDAFKAHGLRNRYLALQSWSDMLAGREATALPDREDGWPAVVRSCARYRKAAAGGTELQESLLKALQEGDRGPDHVRATLRLAHDVLSGRHKLAAVNATKLLSSKSLPAECRPAAEALRAEARRRHVRAILTKRPATRRTLEELEFYLAKQDGKPHPKLKAVLRAAALDVGPALDVLLATGGGDLARTALVLRLLATAFPEGVTQVEAFAEAWPGIREALSKVLQAHLDEVETDPLPTLKLVGLVAALDPKADLPPLETFADWRIQLQAVIDRPTQLLAFMQRFLEVGRLPVGLDELLTSHYLAKKNPIPTQAETPGGVLGIALLKQLSPLDPKQTTPSLEATLQAETARLQELLGERTDRAAQRIRARLALTQAARLIRLGEKAKAKPLLDQAQELGHQPVFEVYAQRARASETQAAKVTSLRARAQDLDTHATRLERSEMLRKLYLSWELSGYPSDLRFLAPLRADAHLELGEALLRTDLSAAEVSSGVALSLLPQSAQAHWLQARVFQAQGRKREARQTALWGMRAALAHEGELKAKLRGLLKEIGPN